MNNKKRNTIQKKIIIEELKKAKTHPTAHDLYDIIRIKMPTISLGTVYRNLDILYKKRIINIIKYTDTEKRYDAKTDLHYHIKCISCSKIEDLSCNTCEDIFEKLNIKKKGYEILGHSLLFEGICPKCKNNNIEVSD